MPQTLEQQERSLRQFIKYRWWFTCVCLFNIAIQISRICDKRSQWPFLLKLALPPGVPIWYSVWENIFGVVLFLFALISWWVRLYNYRRDLLLAEQRKLQKNAKPPPGVWPPPPTA